METIVGIFGIPSQLAIFIMLITIILIAIGLISNRVRDKKRFILWILLFEYIFIVFCSTVFCRQTMGQQRLEMEPLWIYGEVLKGNPNVTPLDILNNLLLLFPIGVMLPIIYPSMKCSRLLIIGMLISISIESLQYLFYKGTAQLDDLVHNTLGCVASGVITKRLLMKTM